MENIKELRKLIALAKKNGLKSLKLGDISFEFNEAEPKSASVPLSGLPLASDDAVMPRDDELLYASTPYYDQLKSQREEANKPQEN